MHSHLRFSVLIPCYNYAHFLGECLQSLIHQTIGDWEAIVVDDASTQGDPLTVVASFNDPRIRFIKHPQNRGAGATFNTAFNNSQNPYVFLLSADDRLHPQFLEKVRHTIIKNPTAQVITLDFLLFGDKEGSWQYPVYDTRQLTLRQWIPGPATVMKRSVWENAGGHYEGPELKAGNLDWDFWLSALSHDIQIIHLPELLYLYRVHGNSITSKRALEDYKIHEFMAKRHSKLFEQYQTTNQFLSIGYLNSALALWNKEDRAQAMQLAQKAWRLHPVIPDVLEEIRESVSREISDIPSQLKQSLQQLNESPDFGVSFSKEAVFAHRHIARLCIAVQDYQTAEEHLLNAIAYMKNNVEVACLCNLLGLVYLKTQNLELADQAFVLALHHDCENRGVYQHKAQLETQKQKFSNALCLCVRGLMLMPNNLSLIKQIGYISALIHDNHLDQSDLDHMTEASCTREEMFWKTIECGSGSRSFLYNSELGRKIYWISRARDLHDKYGNTQGGFETLRQSIRLVCPNQILEIGCGNGRNFPLYDMLSIKEVVGQDISNSALIIAKNRGFSDYQLVQAPVTSLTYPDKYFDLVVSNRVLQHIPPEEVEPIIETICRLGKYIYINEATLEEVGNCFESFYMFVHDYKTLFEKHQFKIIQEMKEENQCRFLLQWILGGPGTFY